MIFCRSRCAVGTLPNFFVLGYHWIFDIVRMKVKSNTVSCLQLSLSCIIRKNFHQTRALEEKATQAKVKFLKVYSIVFSCKRTWCKSPEFCNIFIVVLNFYISLKAIRQLCRILNCVIYWKSPRVHRHRWSGLGTISPSFRVHTSPLPGQRQSNKKMSGSSFFSKVFEIIENLFWHCTTQATHDWLCLQPSLTPCPRWPSFVNSWYEIKYQLMKHF